MVFEVNVEIFSLKRKSFIIEKKNYSLSVGTDFLYKLVVEKNYDNNA